VGAVKEGKLATVVREAECGEFCIGISFFPAWTGTGWDGEPLNVSGIVPIYSSNPIFVVYHVIMSAGLSELANGGTIHVAQSQVSNRFSFNMAVRFIRHHLPSTM